jgi:hypothetical protein
MREGIDAADAFLDMPSKHLPQQWLAGLHGKLMVATQVVLDRGAAELEGGTASLPG